MSKFAIRWFEIVMAYKIYEEFFGYTDQIYVDNRSDAVSTILIRVITTFSSVLFFLGFGLFFADGSFEKMFSEMFYKIEYYYAFFAIWIASMAMFAPLKIGIAGRYTNIFFDEKRYNIFYWYTTPQNIIKSFGVEFNIAICSFGRAVLFLVPGMIICLILMYTPWVGMSVQSLNLSSMNVIQLLLKGASGGGIVLIVFCLSITAFFVCAIIYNALYSPSRILMSINPGVKISDAMTASKQMMWGKGIEALYIAIRENMVIIPTVIALILTVILPQFSFIILLVTMTLFLFCIFPLAKFQLTYTGYVAYILDEYSSAHKISDKPKLQKKIIDDTNSGDNIAYQPAIIENTSVLPPINRPQSLDKFDFTLKKRTVNNEEKVIIQNSPVKTATKVKKDLKGTKKKINKK